MNTLPFAACDARIVPWSNHLPEDQLLLRCAKLDADTVENVKARLETCGVCVIRRSGAGFTTTPSYLPNPTDNSLQDPNIAFLQEMLGESSTSKGLLLNSVDRKPNFNNFNGYAEHSPGTLILHPEGTHSESLPPILILQCLRTPDTGGALRFVDMAGILQHLFMEDSVAAQKLVRGLQRSNAISVMNKLPNGLTHTNEIPFLFRTPYAAVNSLGCRGRFDDNVTCHPDLKPHFDKLRGSVFGDQFRVDTSAKSPASRSIKTL